MKFKVGDKVRVVGYRTLVAEGTLEQGTRIPIPDSFPGTVMFYEKENKKCPGFATKMKAYCGLTARISNVDEELENYWLCFDNKDGKTVDGGGWLWSDWMLASEKVENEEPKIEQKLSCVIVNDGEIIGFIKLTENEKNAVKKVLEAISSDCVILMVEEAEKLFSL